MPAAGGHSSEVPPLPGRKHKPTIAVVTLAGPIVSGRGGPSAFPPGPSSVGGDTIAAALREAAADDDVTAVVLRVDSPGGAVTGSETIWREVARLREAGAEDVLLKCEMTAGHGGVSGRYNAWRERAFELAWLLDVLGLADA